ncbi:hypothetical protein NC653_037107 [Populus alba x Populus x berolinensis]|uniref:Uncharacterized protein n=1 Tax=Populus alba x Populus x berolinensis TaxID=444605 RepID=A0AAD6LLR7_9ROSI|nr:hypothetical protein NC653_037107 [Populus alba x Populus x berolinensis]
MTLSTAHDCVKSEAPVRPKLSMLCLEAKASGESYRRQLIGCPEELFSSATSSGNFRCPPQLGIVLSSHRRKACLHN